MIYGQFYDRIQTQYYYPIEKVKIQCVLIIFKILIIIVQQRKILHTTFYYVTKLLRLLLLSNFFILGIITNKSEKQNEKENCKSRPKVHAQW